MVPVSRSREGPENMVRIALQLDDGSRLQDTFCSGQTLWELLNHFAQTRECLEQPSEASPVCVYMRDEVGERTTFKSLGLTGGSAIIRFAMKRRDQEPGTPGSPAPSLSAHQATGGPLLPLNSVGLSQGDVSHQDEVGTSGASRVDAPAKQISKEPAPAPFVPFSGGGQRLGGPSGPQGETLHIPSDQRPLSEDSLGRERGENQEPPRPPQPVDRDPVVCHPDLGELLQACPAELPDDFFEVTVDDVRRRLAQLRSERKRLEEAPLVTKAFREAQKREKLERYPKVRRRARGGVRPLGDLRDFVRSHLGNPELPFYLCESSCWTRPGNVALGPDTYLFTFITPPKTILDDHRLTLFQADLFPAALVHFGAEEPTGLFLEPRLLERTVSPSAADLLVARGSPSGHLGAAEGGAACRPGALG
uniref:Tether containing UBX domain for GLUT4 n=1 Tax=Panthera tigris altaica TaxID=74533 RepID=A0A8C9KB26_PANTA